MLLSEPVCLTSVCLSVCMSVAYIGLKSRRERPRKTKIGTEVAHVTRDLDTTFKVKGQGHQAALLSTALTHKAAAAVSMGTYSAWEKYCYIASGLRRARRLAAHGGEGRGHIVSPCAQLVDIKAVLIKLCQKTTVSSCLRQCKSLS